METISDILRIIGIPTIIGFVTWLLRLEAQIKRHDTVYEFYKNEVSQIETKLNTFITTVQERIENNRNAADVKLNDVLIRLTDSITELTIATARHDGILAEVQKDIKELAEDIKTKPCVSHYK